MMQVCVSEMNKGYSQLLQVTITFCMLLLLLLLLIFSHNSPNSEIVVTNEDENSLVR